MRVARRSAVLRNSSQRPGMGLQGGHTMSGNIDLRAISADSHITEPANCYVDYIEKAFRERAPHMVPDPRPGETGDVFVIEGFSEPLALGLVAAAGKDPKTLKIGGTAF